MPHCTYKASTTTPFHFFFLEAPIPSSQGTLSGQPPQVPVWLIPPTAISTTPLATSLANQQATASISTPSAPLHTVPSPRQGNVDATAVSSMAVAVPPQGAKPFENPTLPPIPSQILKNIQVGRYVDMGDLLPESLVEMFDKMQKEGKEDSAKTKSRPIDTPL